MEEEKLRYRKKKKNLLEMRVEIKEGVGGTKVRDSGLNPGGIAVIIHVWVEVKHHAVSEAVGEGSNKNGGVEPDSVPSILVLVKWVPAVAEEAGGCVVVG